MTYAVGPLLRSALLRLGVAMLFVLAAASAAPSTAGAHAYLIRSSPQAAARLAETPSTLSLYFTEPFVRSSQRITIRRPGGPPVTLPPATSSGAVVRQRLPKLSGAYVVSWRVLSDDGQPSQGQFAFAVGSGALVPKVAATSTSRTTGLRLVVSWGLFLGLALALGGLIGERLLREGQASARAGRERALVFAGIVLASVAALAELVTIAGDRAGGGLGRGLGLDALADGLRSRPGILTLLALVALTVASGLVSSTRSRRLAVAPVAAAVVLISLRGHSGTSGRWWTMLADAVHFTAAAVWIGALAYLVLLVGRHARRRDAQAAALAVARYARAAVVIAALVVASGMVTAIGQFGSASQLLDTGYGRTLLVKAAFVALALMLALAARLRALHGSGDGAPRPLLLRLARAEVGTLVAVLLVVAALVNLAPPRSTAVASSAAAAGTAALGAPPVQGPAIRLADLAGELFVSLTATPRELRLGGAPPSRQFGGGPASLDVALTRDGRSQRLEPRSCGRGCFSVPYRLRRGVNVLEVAARARGWRGGTVRFRVPWPPRAERPLLLEKVARRLRRTRTVILIEDVTSGTAKAPPPRRFRLSGREFLKADAFARGAVDVRPLRVTEGLTEISFTLPGSDFWYRMWVDRRLRLRREIIAEMGHRISRTLSYPASAGRAVERRPMTP